MKISLSILKSLYLFAVVFLIMLARGLPLWLLSFLIILALAAPLIRELGKKSDLDERQIYIGHLSSHISFFVLIGLLLFVLIKKYIAQGLNPAPEWYMLLIIPLTVKFLISLFQNYGAVQAARRTGYFFAGIFFIFILLSHGFSIESLIGAIPFILIVVVAWASRKAVLLSGIGFLLLAVGLTVFFRAWLRLDIYVRLIMYTLVPLPLFISAVALLFEFKAKEENPL